jgi:FkbM family methyltransferase
VHEQLLHLWPFTSPKVRRAVRHARRLRRNAYERCGSDRYSHPARADLDRKLARYLPGYGGVFVEAGAFDGYTQSNTYWFERFRGWRGVLVEPIPELAALARRERPRSQVVECALVPPNANLESVRMRYGGSMSLVAGAHANDEQERAHAELGARLTRRTTYQLRVPARTLTAVLDDAGVTAIDLLVLDVEGYEASALRGLDLDRHLPRFILVEILEDARQRAQVEAALGGRYTLEARLSDHDHLYRHSDVRVP